MNRKQPVRVTKLSVVVSTLCGWLPALLALSPPTWAQSAPSAGSNPHATPEAEIALALSACPPSVASKAGVYVLGKSGYVKVRDSLNGFTAIVQHALPTSQEPQCMDAEGARTFLPRMMMVAELRAQGKTPEDIRAAVSAAFAKGALKPPTHPGVDYMLSTQNLVPDDKGVVGHFPPHVMFYGPYMTNADIGSEGQAAGGPAFVAGEGSPYALVIVPVAEHGGPGNAPHGDHTDKSPVR
jgi:hypothetical protein